MDYVSPEQRRKIVHRSMAGMHFLILCFIFIGLGETIVRRDVVYFLATVIFVILDSDNRFV